MNTKQKLTLGIAAIFMVTLTIVGVTYAYFVTRVNYSTTAVVDVRTATIGSAFIAADDSTKLVNAFPGDKVYALFAVQNASAVDVPIFINLATALKEKESGSITANEFIHTDKTGDALTASCYTSSALPKAVDNYNGENGASKLEITATPESGFPCYDRTKVYATEDAATTALVPRYNNIMVKLYRIPTTGSTAWSTEENADNSSATHFAGIGDDFVDIPVDWKNATNGTVAQANINRLLAIGTRVQLNGNDMAELAPYAEIYGKPVMDKTGHAITIADAEVVAARPEDTEQPDSYNLYMLEVEYQNVQKNQNVENDAYVSLKVDIDTFEITYTADDIQETLTAAE